MPVKVRPFIRDDFEPVVALLLAGKVEPPTEMSDLLGPCFVAEDNGEIVGVIFAIAGLSSKAYIDYLAVKEEYRGSRVFFSLLQAIEAELRRLGVKRYTFHLEKHNTKGLAQLYKRRERYDVTKLRDLHYFSREMHE